MESLNHFFETQVLAVLRDDLQRLHERNTGAALKVHHGAELDQVPALDPGPPGNPTGLTGAALFGRTLLPGLRVQQPITAGPKFFFEINGVLGGHGAGHGPPALVHTAILKNSHESSPGVVE